MDALDPLVALLAGRRVAVLSGAGCSTESGIPDYGGLGSRHRRHVIRYQEFVADVGARARYWARSLVGWRRVADARPNAAHIALAELEGAGIVTGVITQNVDGLHHCAGSRRVVELHGSLVRVRCLSCGGIESRAGVQQRLLALNPEFCDRTAAPAPDGDADVTGRPLASFRVADCGSCGGVLKPDVVLFGECVPRPRLEDAWAAYASGEILLVIGSSLAVYSGYRFVLRAVQEARPVAIVNLGPTRGDGHATVKVSGSVGHSLPRLAAELRCVGRVLGVPA